MIHPGILTTIKAAKLKLWRLTAWEDPSHILNMTYTCKYSRTLVSRRWEDWCLAEAVRIGSDPSRHAAVVVQKTGMAVFVNRVAGNAGDDVEHED